MKQLWWRPREDAEWAWLDDEDNVNSIDDLRNQYVVAFGGAGEFQVREQEDTEEIPEDPEEDTWQGK